ncbi:MAG: acyl--CoA ligase family protein [Candidatus Dormibacteraeota bacterium]|nr:acyl--CoA ligase family protein [Candidatus Dormibacteraeota bacterium]
MTSKAVQVFRDELTPVNWIERAGEAYADRQAVVDGQVSYTWREFRDRSRRLASALRAAGLTKGDRIAFLAWNSEPALLAHFAVPQAGGVLVAINTRLSPDEVSYIIEHSGSTMVFHATDLAGSLEGVDPRVRRVVLGEEFETFLAAGSDTPLESWLEDEYEILAIDYTSGTTGRPKGVMYHHRGAYLNALAMAHDLALHKDSSYLWTLPMFHCNGWTLTWAMAAIGCRSVCIAKIDPAQVWDLFRRGEVTAFCAAPTVLIMLVNDPNARRLESPIRLLTAGAPPSPTIIGQMADLGFELEHVYGLTETYGPFTVNIPQPGYGDLPPEQRAKLRARQGYPNLLAGYVRVVDEEMKDVPTDGSTMGEVVMRGNVVMKGYFANDEATEQAFRGGWFHSGDVGVMHPDGVIELRDRKKDIIISGGENISTIEVEQAVATHPAVMECAVIAVPDEKWGEVVKAFVVLKPGHQATPEEIIEHVRGRIAHFKAPRHVEFGDLPKTSTGKIQKFVLRDREWAGKDKRIN